MYTKSDAIEFLKRVFGRVDIYNNGNVQVRCPNTSCSSHARKRKLAINIERGWIWHCWVCGQKGSFPYLLKRHHSSYLQEYAKKFLDQRTIKAIEDERPVVTLPDDFKLLATRQDSKNPEIRRALRYLKKRGLGERDLWYFKFGISNQGRFDNRIIMPSFDAKGEINYFAARALLPDAFVKYMLAKTSKKEIVFNELHIDWKQELTLVEGQFDLTKANSNATCISGSDLAEDSLLFLKIVQNETPILLALDEDMKFTKTPKLAKKLMNYGIKVRVMSMGEFEDVGEMSRSDFTRLAAEAEPWNRTSVLRQKIRSLV